MTQILFFILAAFLGAEAFAAQTYSSAVMRDEAISFKAQNVQDIQDVTFEGQNFSVIPDQKNRIFSGKTFSQNSLLVGYPEALIGESHHFGAVIVGVSDPTSQEFGDLKMGSIIGIVRSEIEKHFDQGVEKTNFILRGSFTHGVDENTPLETILTVPVREIDEESHQVVLDFSHLGDTLDFKSYLVKDNPGFEDYMKKFKHLGSRVSRIDFSLKTLSFDLVSDFLVQAQNEKEGKKLTLTTRWFLRLGSTSSPFFVVRNNVPGVGFFYSNYNVMGAPIARFGISDLQRNPIRYYIKNVPLKWRSAFSSAFEDWNHKLQSTLGYDLLTYEFLEANDPRNELIIAGDIRYNVLEWDITNRAQYGGLGPSLSNVQTGEILAAQTLIQGPGIEEIYKEWFKLTKPSLKPKRDLNTAIALRIKNQNSFYLPAQDPRLQDRLQVPMRLDFIPLPEGYTYDSYMDGYWKDIVAHELGHNLGLTHNFKGSFRDDGSKRVGTISWSVMEYLNRLQRHLDRVGEYDVMAIAYGYLGKMPTVLNHYCSDEHQGVDDFTRSPECSSNDATSDAYGYFKENLNRVLDSVLARGSDQAPVWKTEELTDYIPDYLTGLASYATTASHTASTWEFFFLIKDRPQVPSEIQAYVMNDLEKLICDASLDQEIQKKSTPEAQALTEKNLKDFRTLAFGILANMKSPFELVNQENFSCYQP